MVTVSPAIVALVSTTVSLGVYVGYAGLLTWTIVGSAIATFVYSLGRYTQVVGRRTVRVGVHMVWSQAQRVWRIFLIACVVWGAAVIAVGDHVVLETPMVRDGHYVTIRYGHVVRHISRSEYQDLKMGRFRLFGGLAGILAAIGATISAARSRIEIPDSPPAATFGERCD
jgi:MFS family permease